MIDDKKLDDLKAKHGGEVFVLTAKSGEEIVVRPPNDAEWGAFQADQEKVGRRALKGLVRTCLAHPSSDELDRMLNRRPALANIFGLRVLEIAGMEEEAQVKKA